MPRSMENYIECGATWNLIRNSRHIAYAGNFGRVILLFFLLNPFIMNLWPQSATYNNVCRPSSDFGTISFFTCTSAVQLNTILGSTIATRCECMMRTTLDADSFGNNRKCSNRGLECKRLTEPCLCMYSKPKIQSDAVAVYTISFSLRSVSVVAPRILRAARKKSFFLLLSFTFEMLKTTRIACLCVLLQWIYNKLLLLIL